MATKLNAKYKTLKLYPIDYPLENLYQRVRSGTIKLGSDFELRYQWDANGYERASKLIESCLMRLPIPACYFVEDAQRNYVLIDGLQRINSFFRFFENAFALKGLRVYKALNGMYFEELPKTLQRELQGTALRCIILRKENPKALLIEVITRLKEESV